MAPVAAVPQPGRRNAAPIAGVIWLTVAIRAIQRSGAELPERWALSFPAIGPMR
jgi:hypothetical protein